MDAEGRTRDEQAALWNGAAGRGWVEAQALLDGVFKPFEALLADAAAGSSGPVLDVGCGTGATTLALARLGRPCLGVDISAPMIAAARARATAEGSSARFLCADAQAQPFEPARFGLVLSRFGLMFFQDPAGAFANLRRAAKPDARLHAVVWRSPEENPFMTAAERAAAPLLPGFPARDPEAPGQFAFADPARVRRILEAGGWAGIRIEALDVACAFPEAELLRYLSLLGPVGRKLPELEEGLRQQVIERVLAAFRPYVREGEVRFDAACWRLDARATSPASASPSRPR